MTINGMGYVQHLAQHLTIPKGSESFTSNSDCYFCSSVLVVIEIGAELKGISIERGRFFINYVSPRRKITLKKFAV